MYPRNKYVHFLESNILLKKSLMTSNVNLDYSSETTNFVWQQAQQKSSQCLIFNIKKDQGAASESDVINHHQIFIYVMHSVIQKSLPLRKARQILVFIKLD